MRVFVSYSRRNTALVSPLIAYLQEQGVDVWIDRENSPPGTPEFDEAIREGVQGADYVLYMGTPEARKSTAVNGELQIVDRYQKPILPIWLSGEDWNDAAPSAYNSTRYLDARGSTLESFGRQLLHVLDQQSRVAASSTPASPDAADVASSGTAYPRSTPGSSRRNVMVAAIISVVVILLTVYVLLRLVAPNGTTPPSAAQRAAESTVQSFYSAVAKQDYSTAYGYLATKQQADLTKYTFTLFAQQSDAQNGKVTAFHEIRYDRDTNNALQATIQEQVTRAHNVTYTISLQMTQEADGSWKILSEDHSI
jgi:hypothetical protein